MPSRLRQQGSQVLDAPTQDGLGPVDPTHGAFDLDHPPALLTLRDLASILGISLAAARHRERLHAFDWLKVEHPDGPRKFSGYLLAKNLKGERTQLRTFGRQTFGR